MEVGVDEAGRGPLAGSVVASIDAVNILQATQHMEALQTYGPIEHVHRLSFAPVLKALKEAQVHA